MQQRILQCFLSQCISLVEDKNWITGYVEIPFNFISGYGSMLSTVNVLIFEGMTPRLASFLATYVNLFILRLKSIPQRGMFPKDPLQSVTDVS